MDLQPSFSSLEKAAPRRRRARTVFIGLAGKKTCLPPARGLRFFCKTNRILAHEKRPLSARDTPGLECFRSAYPLAVPSRPLRDKIVTSLRLRFFDSPASLAAGFIPLLACDNTTAPGRPRDENNFQRNAASLRSGCGLKKQRNKK